MLTCKYRESSRTSRGGTSLFFGISSVERDDVGFSFSADEGLPVEVVLQDSSNSCPPLAAVVLHFWGSSAPRTHAEVSRPPLISATGSLCGIGSSFWSDSRPHPLTTRRSFALSICGRSGRGWRHATKMARPQSYVHAEQPPPLQHDFNFLAEQALRSKCVFRVWQPNSASPLIWTNFVSDSGFAAPNGNLARLSAPAYLDHFRDNRGQVDWAEGLYMKQTVVDHILQKWRQTALYYNGMVADEEGVDIPEDDKSPWISTSKDLMWCVWETARRLAIMLANIDRTYREASGMDPDEKTRNWVKAQEDAVVHLSIIRHHSGTIGLQDARRNSLESHIDAKGPTSRVDRQVMSVSIQGEFAHAKRLASSASEILYYGRIFAANIASDLEWSVTVSRASHPRFRR